jgi:hypothetical protein
LSNDPAEYRREAFLAAQVQVAKLLLIESELVQNGRIKGLTLRAIADELMELGIWTHGCSKRWTATQVRRILQRALEGAPARIARLEAEAGALRWLLDPEGGTPACGRRCAATV